MAQAPHGNGVASIKSFTAALGVRMSDRGSHASTPYPHAYLPVGLHARPHSGWRASTPANPQRASAPAPLAIGNIGTGNISTLATFSLLAKNFFALPLRHRPRCAKLPAEPLDGFLSSRTVLPTRSGAPVRKDRGLSNFRNKDEDGRLLILAKKQRPNHRGICTIALSD